MYFKPPQDNHNNFYHPLNKVNEEIKTIDKKKAKDIYDKLKKGSEIEVDFGNAITRGGKPITLKVTSGHRVVGASKVGRIILVDKENPRGMKYKLFDRNGSVSLAQSDMGTILRDMKIVKEGVEELDESRDDFDYLDIEAARQDAKLEAPKVVKTRQGFQVMVFSRKLRKHIPQGSPHRTKAAAEKDAKMFEDVQIDEERGTKIKVMVKGDENVYERMTRALMYARLPGYEGATFNKRKGMTTYAFDAKKHTSAVRKKFAKIIQTHNGEFVQSIEEGFASDAQRRAAFASGYKAKGKKKKNEEEIEEADINMPDKPKNAIKKPKNDSQQTVGEGLRQAMSDPRETAAQKRKRQEKDNFDLYKKRQKRVAALRGDKSSRQLTPKQQRDYLRRVNLDQIRAMEDVDMQNVTASQLRAIKEAKVYKTLNNLRKGEENG